MSVNAEVVRRWFTAANARDEETLRSLLHPDAIQDDVAEALGGALKVFDHMTREINVLDVREHSDQTVSTARLVLRWKEDATVADEKLVFFRYRIAEGKIIEGGQYRELDGAFRDAGIEPE